MRPWTRSPRDRWGYETGENTLWLLSPNNLLRPGRCRHWARRSRSLRRCLLGVRIGLLECFRVFLSLAVLLSARWPGWWCCLRPQVRAIVLVMGLKLLKELLLLLELRQWRRKAISTEGWIPSCLADDALKLSCRPRVRVLQNLRVRRRRRRRLHSWRWPFQHLAGSGHRHRREPPGAPRLLGPPAGA